MMDSLIFDACYAGLNDTGQAILRPAFATQIRETYRRNGWAPPRLGPVASEGQAMDAAIADEEPPWTDYADLNQLYERLLNCDEQPTFASTIKDDDFEGRAELTRQSADVVHAAFTAGDPAEEAKLFAEFKRARAWDRAASDAIMRRDFELQRAYEELLRGENRP